MKNIQTDLFGSSMGPNKDSTTPSYSEAGSNRN